MPSHDGYPLLGVVLALGYIFKKIRYFLKHLIRSNLVSLDKFERYESIPETNLDLVAKFGGIYRTQSNFSNTFCNFCGKNIFKKLSSEDKISFFQKS